MNNDYLYNCKGCQKPDKEYPNKEIECEECKNGWVLDEPISSNEDCWECGGYGRYTPRTKVEHHKWARNDAYGIYTGLYCDKCYKDNYPYRMDRYYEPAYAGERMEPDE